MWQKLILFSTIAVGVQCTYLQQNHHAPPMQYGGLQDMLDDGDNLVRSMAAAKPRLGLPIPKERRMAWKATCDSEQPGFACRNAIDGRRKTYWQTKNLAIGNPATADPLPHFIELDLGMLENITGLEMIPVREDDDDDANKQVQGSITTHKVFVSQDRQNWDDLAAYGTWYNDTRDEKYSIFQPRQARFIRLEAIAASGGVPYIKVRNIDIYAAANFTEPPKGLGKWGPTVDFPLVPVGVFVDPETDRIITFSSYAHDQWSQDKIKYQTFTSTWDLHTATISQRLVQETHHDMFCPGMSYDVRGRMILTGGTTAQKVSIFNGQNDSWVAAPRLVVPRGYHGQALTSDGRVFTIGGSWAPKNDPGNRTAEIWDPALNNNWTKLEGLQAERIETSSEWPQAVVGRPTSYRADNHVWLFGWKNGSVFHAGPKNETHWITTTGSGAYFDAGVRRDGDHVDKDSMCGNAVMYDAAAGKILTMGGAPRYDFLPPNQVKTNISGEKSSSNAFIITLGEVNATVNIRKTAQSMNRRRIFHNSVILPNGEVFVVGGMENGQFFNEQTAHDVPEIYSPTKDAWTEMAPHHTVRVYHSVALLLPDATIMAGGSGLCTSCYVNHFDAQIYTPQYLLTSTGEPATRPVIKTVSAKKVWPGDTFSFTTDSEVVDGSLVRYGGATHALNNDQRRIALTTRKVGKNEYEVVVPADGGIAIPGPWMLFVHNGDGVPSVASTVYVQIQGSQR